jgi:hypothetical protein
MPPFSYKASSERSWRNHDLQRDRRQGPLSRSCEADLYGRDGAQSGHCAPRDEVANASISRFWRELDDSIIRLTKR